MSLYESLSLVLEAAVLIILIMEYIYDKRLNEHVKSLKRRTKRRFEFESLTSGDSK